MSSIQSLHQNFSSVSEFSEAISQGAWSTRFRQLDRGVGAARFSAVINSTAILHRVFCDRRTKQDVIPPNGYQTFGLPISRLSSSTIDNRPLTNQKLLFVDEQQGFSSVGDPGFDAFTVAIEHTRMSELSENLGLPDPGSNPNFWGSEIAPEPSRLTAVKGIISQIFTLEQSAAQDPEFQATLHEMLSLQLPSALMQLCMDLSPTNNIPLRNRELALQRALAYIEAHPKEALTVETLCTAAATSMSTLERAFRERFSISPKRYITVQRLNHVHAALKNNCDGRRRSITDIAGEWGFWHTSQFAVDYKSLFGYLPSETKSR